MPRAMPSKKNVKKIIHATIVRSVTNFVTRRSGRTPNFQILDLIIPRERKIRSIVGGLETSIGTTLWEPLAKNLARANGFKIVDRKLKAPTHMPHNLATVVNQIHQDRVIAGGIYTAISGRDYIRNTCQPFIANPLNQFTTPAAGQNVDVWLKKGSRDFLFDIKTSSPNVRAYTGLMKQVTDWYSWYFSETPTGNPQVRIVFPYNPHEPQIFWAATKGNGRPLEPTTEGYVGNQFWNFCSGRRDTMDLIYEVFSDLSRSKILQTKFDDLFV